MKQLTCEICQSTNLTEYNGVFICETCGCKYSVKQVNQMMNENDLSLSESKSNINSTSETNSMFCSKCGQKIATEAVICPACGCPTQNYNKNQTNQFPAYQQYDTQTNNYEKDISSAKTMGLIAIIGGLFIPLIGWIFGGIGIAKCNKYPNDYSVQSVKKQNTIGILIATVMFFVNIIILLCM